VTTATGFNNSGTLAVAAGTTATITGDYTQAATGVFQTGLSGNATNYGKLVVTGAADLSASNKLAVDVAGTPTLAIGDVMTGVISAGTLTAGPTYTVTDNSTLFNFTAATNGNAIDLTVQRGLTALDSVAKTGKSSAFGAAGVFDTFLSGGASGDMGTVVTALGKLATEKEVADAVGETLPLMTGGLTQVAASKLRGVSRIVESRQDASSGMSSGDGFIENGRGWVKPLGSWAKQNDSDAVYGYKAQTYGVVLGADGEHGESSRIGAAFAYTNSNVDSNNSAQNAKVDSYQVVLYGNSSLNQNYELNWQADYGYNKNKGSRDISFVNRTASSDYSSSSMHVGTGVGRSMQLSRQTRFIPTIRADYTSITDKAYTETGAGALNLVVNGQTTNEFIIAASGKVSHSLDDTSSVSANLGVGYDTLAKQNSITAAFQGGGAAFTTVGIKPSSTLVRAGLGYAKSTAGGIEIMVRYDIEARSGFTGQTASAKFRKAF
jgi:outer membrane autotransporter protein